MEYVYECSPPAGPTIHTPNKPSSIYSCLEHPKDQEISLRSRKSANNNLTSDTLRTQEDINGIVLVIDIWDYYSSKHTLILALKPT